MKKTYKDKLKDPRWQRKRLEVMDRDDFACRDCGSKTATLNIHHASYQFGREPWEYDERFLVTLCESCHHDAEARRKFILECTADPETQKSTVNFLMGKGVVETDNIEQKAIAIMTLHGVDQLDALIMATPDKQK